MRTVPKEGDPDVSSKTWIEITLKGGDKYPVTEDYVKELKDVYPKADVEAELRIMANWCDANPTRRKTKKGIKRFISGWLGRSKPRYDRGMRRVTRNDYDNERSFLD